jgi:ParB family chromosome partitioning protein
MAAPKKSRGLGKGLDALFGDAEVSIHRNTDKADKVKETADPAPKTASAENDAKETDNRGISYIDINDIKPNSDQPRKTFDEDKLAELAASIEEHGLIQPVVLRKMKKGYEIVAGERRWRAARLIGIKEIPCIVRELTDEENMLLAIIENMQREDLNPIEEAEGIHQMIETYGLTQEKVSKSVGKSRPYITNCLRLLKLPEAVRTYVAEGSLSAGHAKVLAGIDEEDKQIKLADSVIAEGWSVRQLENNIKQEKPVGRPAARTKVKNPNVKRVEEDLKEALGTKVNLNQNKKGNKGKIEIEFYSKEELERLIELLKKVK